MSSQPLAAAPGRKLTRYFRTPHRDLTGEWNVAIRFTVNSDAWRIFQALTRPEYLETWLTLPGDDPQSYLVAWQQQGSYRLDHYHNGRRDLIIDGSYRVCRRRKLLFTWRTRGDTVRPDSLVYIGLHGNFTNTILELHHRGLSTASDYFWHQEMWNSSLQRLSRIFQR